MEQKRLVLRISIPLVWRYYRDKARQRTIIQFKHGLKDGPTRDKDEWGPWEYVDVCRNTSNGDLETVKVCSP